MHPRGKGSLLSNEEIATLFRPPTATAAAKKMQTMEFRELEPPPNFLFGSEPDVVTLGRGLFWVDTRTIGMDADARDTFMSSVQREPANLRFS